MTRGWLTRSARQRPLLLAALVLLLAAGIAALLLTGGHHESAQTAQAPAPTTPAPPAVIGTRPPPPPLSAAQQAAALAVGRRFLDSYLPVLYGRRPPRTIRDADPHVRAALQAAERMPSAPANRHPRVISLSEHSQTSSSVVLIAVITDRVQAPYQVVFQLTDHQGRWQVSELANY